MALGKDSPLSWSETRSATAGLSTHLGMLQRPFTNVDLAHPSALTAMYKYLTMAGRLKHTSAAHDFRPSPVMVFYILRHVNADELLSLVRPDLQDFERASNLIYSELLERSIKPDPYETRQQYGHRILQRLSSETEYDGDESFPTDTRPTSEFWLTLWTRGQYSVKLDCVISCQRDPLGERPLFFFFNGKSGELTDSYLEARIPILCRRLLSVLPSPRRIFSCFGPTALTNAFADNWSRIAENPRRHPPLYHATATYCTRETLLEPAALPYNHSIEVATEEYIEAVAELCKGFADDSIEYRLDKSRALQESTYHITHRHMWIYIVEEEVVAIVALTRRTPSVVAISKVYTDPEARKKGHAGRLVGHVCRTVFQQRQDMQVVLFVSHGNSAASVYGNVGFVGVGRRSVDGTEAALVEDWMEVGFADSDKGYW